MTTPTTYVTCHESAVDRGVELLDAKLGRDVWLPRVNLNTLDVGSSQSCVACHATGVTWFGRAYRELFGDFESYEDVVEFEGSPSRTEHYGFGILARADRDFTGLTEAWKRRVRALRGEEEL